MQSDENQEVQPEELKPFAAKYIWWKKADEAVARPSRVIAQVMNIGDWGDVQDLARLVGDAALRDALRRAEAGQFNARSWHYWHYRLGLARHADEVPPQPERRFG